MFSFGRTPDEREAPGTPPASAGGEHGAGTDGAGAPRPELSPAFGRIDVPRDVPRDVRPLRAAASLDGISAASTSGAPLNRDGYPEGNLDGRPEPHPDVPIDDPFSAIDAPPPAERAMLWAPPAFLTGVILVSALGASARSSGTWAVLVPALVWVTCVVTSFPLARTLLSPNARPRRWDAWARRMRPRALDSLDRVAPDSGHRAGPMVAAALGGFAVLTAATAIGRWLTSAADVHAGPAAWLGDALGVVGALGLGLFAGALSALGSGYLLVGYVAFWSWRRRVALHAVPDAAAAWLMRHAAHLLAPAWGPATQADRRRRVRRRLLFAAGVLPRGATTPEGRAVRLRAAAALRTLADAVDGTGNAERERIRRALLDAAPDVEQAHIAVARDALRAAVREVRTRARRAGRSAFPSSSRHARAGTSARTSAWASARMGLPALGVVVGVLGTLLASAALHHAGAAAAASGGGHPSTALSVVEGYAAKLAEVAGGLIYTGFGAVVIYRAAPVLLPRLRAWRPDSPWLDAVRGVSISHLLKAQEGGRGLSGGAGETTGGMTADVAGAAASDAASLVAGGATGAEPEPGTPPSSAPARRAVRGHRRRPRSGD